MLIVRMLELVGDSVPLPLERSDHFSLYLWRRVF